MRLELAHSCIQMQSSVIYFVKVIIMSMRFSTKIMLYIYSLRVNLFHQSKAISKCSSGSVDKLNTNSSRTQPVYVVPRKISQSLQCFSPGSQVDQSTTPDNAYLTLRTSNSTPHTD